MSALRVESFTASREKLTAFEQVRDAVGIYTGAAPEPVPEGTLCFVAWEGEAPFARASAWVAPGLHHAPGASGLVGHYEALRPDAGVAVLTAACRALSERRVARVLGPMNGSTWSRYRLALRASESDPPPFLAEPWNPARYPDDFAAAGFVPEAHYESREDDRLDEDARDAEQLAESVRRAGVRVRTLDLARFDEELAALFALSLSAFADNLFYTPIDLPAFRAQYEKMRPFIDPELVLIAEDARGRPVAFQFAYQDPLAPPGLPPRVIVKTVATSVAMRGLGLGGHLLDRIRRRARALSCGSVIHALIHAHNLSLRMSARHHGRQFRRYALYRWAP